MNQCPMFALRKDLKGRAAWEGRIRINCGNCANWDWGGQRCQEEEKLKKTEIKREV